MHVTSHAAFVLLLSVLTLTVSAQTNMRFSSASLTEIFAGDYVPGAYPMEIDYGTPEDLASYINDAVSPDSIMQYLVEMQQFETRNSGSDTLSDTRGIGAARNWMRARFDSFSAASEGRLLIGFFEFDHDICGVTRHKNVVAMLPGTVPDAGVIILEAHLDSRCSVLCDTTCLAMGMEDNASGVALVLEAARVLSRYNYLHTLVFVGTTGEEQGLDGARAIAEYADQQHIKIKLVQNNDIVGGILCGETSSQPSCPGKDHIDSTQVRLFSQGGFNSPHKALCRFIKLQYAEMLEPLVAVPMRLTIMSAEDRVGRGGDHIPFRQLGYTAMRFTSANEHGDAFIHDEYHDRQHTSDDILGLDFDGDGTLDTFFVDFNYLGRNTAINTVSAAMAAIGPETPRIGIHYFDRRNFYIEVESDTPYPEYRVGIRTDFNDFDSLYLISDGNTGYFETADLELFIFLSVMAVDSHGVESLPSEEIRVMATGVEDVAIPVQRAYLLQNRPNPFDESTIIAYWVEEPLEYRNAEIVVVDLNGKVIQRLTTIPQLGMNELLYHHGYGTTGAYVYTLVIDGIVMDEKRMIFAN